MCQLEGSLVLSFQRVKLQPLMSQPPLAPELPPQPRFRRSIPPVRGRRTILLVGLLLLLGAAVAAWYFFASPRLLFTNELAALVRLAAEQQAPITLAPGETVRLTTSRGRAMVALWELVRPLSADGRPMGSEVRGSIVVRDPGGEQIGRASCRERVYGPV